MDYKKVVAITGMSGLYHLVSAQNNGAIVQGLEQGKGTSFVSSRKHQLTPLESIEIYTTDENLRLDEVFTKMKNFDQEALDAINKNDKNHFRALFKEILPNFDEERVYTSDIKKIFKWYELLKNHDLLDFEEEPEEIEDTEEASDQKEDATDE